MRIKIIRPEGQEVSEFKTTSYLIDDVLLIDAGNVASTLEVVDQTKIEGIFVTESHIDHISDIAFLADNCIGMKENAFQVFAHPIVKENILNHLLNNKVWPDFTKIPTANSPVIRLNEVTPEKEINFLGYKLFPILVCHSTGAMALIVEKDDRAVLFIQDTGPNDKVWVYAKQRTNLKAVFGEISYPAGHKQSEKCPVRHDTKSFEKELQKIPEGALVYVGGAKRPYHAEIGAELAQKSLNIHILTPNDAVVEI
jgi:cAMP phosphodiesterase